MQLKHLLFAVLVATLGFSASAEARKLSDQDKAVARKLTAHLGAMGDIMDKHSKDANKALDTLEAYVAKNKGSIKAIVGNLAKISKELDADEQKKFEAYVKADPDMKKFMTAVMAFGMSLGNDADKAERFGKIMRSLAPDEDDDGDDDVPKVKEKPKSKDKSKAKQKPAK